MDIQYLDIYPMIFPFFVGSKPDEFRHLGMVSPSIISRSLKGSLSFPQMRDMLVSTFLFRYRCSNPFPINLLIDSPKLPLDLP